MRKYIIGSLVLFILIIFSAPIISAKEVEPGITIDQTNYKQYTASLQKLLSPGTFQIIIPALRDGVTTMPIIETQQYPQFTACDKATKKYAGTCKVADDNRLLNWKGGVPFPAPKTGAELVWNLDRKYVTADQYTFVGNFYLYNKARKLEREYQWKLFSLRYNGRVLNPPIPEFPGNNDLIRLKECFVMRSPYDIKGFCFIRVRYEDLYRSDDVFSYIPAIRRVRRLTGADVCDPMLGTDTIYDDFELLRQKITDKMSFKMRETKILVPTKGIVDKRPERKGAWFQTTWQIRQVYVLTIIEEDPDYIYSKRNLYLEKQRLTGGGYYLNTYDRKGRLYRSQVYWACFSDKPEYVSDVWGARYDNHQNGHHTMLEGWFNQGDPVCEPEIFSFRFLVKRAR